MNDWKRNMQLWDTAPISGRQGRLVPRPVGDPLPPSVNPALLAYSAGKVAAAVGANTVQLFKAATMEPLGSPINVERAVTVVAFTPSGQVATGEDDSTVRIWDAISHEPIGAPMTGIGPVTNLNFSGDGGTLAAWGGGRELQLWNTQTSQPIGDPLKTNADMTAVAVSFDGHMVAAGSQDGVIKLWDTRDGTAHPQLAGENAKVTTLEFNSTGTRLLSASTNGTVRVWPIDEPKPDALCAKLSENMSLEEWADVVSPEIEYRDVCDGLPRGEPTG